MSRTKHSSILAATLLAAAVLPAAQGQDATRSGAQSANQSSPAATPGVPSQGPAAGPGPPAPGGTGSPPGSAPASGTGSPASGTGSAAAAAGSPASPSGADKPPPVCFKLTGRCVDTGTGPKAQAGTPTLKRIDTQQKGNLNLSAPDVRTVIPADELKEPLPTNEQVTEVQESQTVAVKGNPVPADVPVGFGAIWWALNHPSQAWRILTPYE